MTKPLPCPFCGCAPVILPEDPKREGDAWGKVVCSNDKCAAIPSTEYYDDQGTKFCKEQAILRWNTRY